jgi:hypothetical protein
MGSGFVPEQVVIPNGELPSLTGERLRALIEPFLGDGDGRP